MGASPKRTTTERVKGERYAPRMSAVHHEPNCLDRSMHAIMHAELRSQPQDAERASGRCYRRQSSDVTRERASQEPAGLSEGRAARCNRSTGVPRPIRRRSGAALTPLARHLVPDSRAAGAPLGRHSGAPSRAAVGRRSPFLQHRSEHMPKRAGTECCSVICRTSQDSTPWILGDNTTVLCVYRFAHRRISWKTAGVEDPRHGNMSLPAPAPWRHGVSSSSHHAANEFRD